MKGKKKTSEQNFSTSWINLRILTFGHLLTLNYDPNQAFQKAKSKPGFFKRGNKHNVTLTDIIEEPNNDTAHTTHRYDMKPEQKQTTLKKALMKQTMEYILTEKTTKKR